MSDPPPDSLDAKLQRQIGDHAIKPTIIKGWLKGAGEVTVDLTRALREGATDAIILRAQVQMTFHVKFSIGDAPRERDGYAMLARSDVYRPHLVAPLFQELDTPEMHSLMLVPYENASTLSDYLINPDANHELVRNVYRDFLDVNRELWRTTRSADRVPLHETYGARVRTRAVELARNLGVDRVDDLEVVVNGEPYGALNTMVNALVERLDTLPRPTACVTHGDENATNIMIPFEDISDRKHTGWLVVDYVNSATDNDWVMSVAKMLQDWRCDHVLRIAERDPAVESALAASYSLDGATLTLKYDKSALETHAPTVCRDLEILTLEAADRAANDCGEGLEWKERLAIASASIAFGSAALRMRAHGFALPVLLDRALSPLRQDTRP